MNYVNNKEKVSKLIIFQIILNVLIVFFTIFKKSQVSSIIFNFQFIILIATVVKMISRSKFNKKEFQNIILLFIIISFSFIFVLNGANVVTFSYIKKVIFFSSALIFFFITTKINSNKKTVEIILKLNIIIAIFYIINYLVMPRDYIAGGLTFNFTNPNLTAMWLIHPAMYILLGTFFYNNKLMRFICIALACMVIYFIYETGSRTTLISIITFIILIIYCLIKKRIKISNFLSSTLTLIPFIGSVIYMIMIENKTINIFRFMESEGKSLTSRYDVWVNAFNAIKEKPITGDYYGISQGTGMSQMHNSHIDILASYGIIVFILFSIYIINIVNSIKKRCINRFQLLSLIAFLIVIVMGIGEAAVFTGSLGMYVSSGGFLLLARYNEL